MSTSSRTLSRCSALACVAFLFIDCSASETDGGEKAGTGGTGGGAGAPSGSGGQALVGGTGGASTGGSGTGIGGSSLGGSTAGGTPSSGGSAGAGNATGGAPVAGAAGSSMGGSAQGGAGGTGGTSKGGAGAGGSAGGGKSQGGAGGSANGGSSTGGAPTGGTGGAAPTGSYPCDGSTAGYKALMIKTGSTWAVTNAGKQVYSGADMEAALRAAYGSLTAGRTAKESILVQGSGDIPAASQIPMPSYTVLNVCGTVNVTGTGAGGDKSPFYARNARDIEIPNLKMTGAPAYGIFFRGTNNMHLGQIDLRLSTSSPGIGIRVDTSANAGGDTTFNQNLRIDRVFGSGMSSHIVETYGINNITVGTVEGEDVGECGLLFNRSTNATVELVSCTDCAVGVGYAAFRMANNNGRINNGYTTVNIVAKKVVARGGGRGIFSVSGSGAARIEHVDLQDTGNNSILLENAHNVTVGNPTQQSRIASSGQLRIAGTSSNITFQNIAVSGTSIGEEPCATNSTWTMVNGAPTGCN